MAKHVARDSTSQLLTLKIRAAKVGFTAQQENRVRKTGRNPRQKASLASHRFDAHPQEIQHFKPQTPLPVEQML